MRYLTTARIRRWRPCEDDFDELLKIYPKRVPLTRKVGRELMAHNAEFLGIDVVWGLIHMLSAAQRTEFCVVIVRRALNHAARCVDDEHARALRKAARALDGSCEKFTKAARAAWTAEELVAADAAEATEWAVMAIGERITGVAAGETAEVAVCATEAAADEAAERRRQFNWLCDALEIPEK